MSLNYRMLRQVIAERLKERLQARAADMTPQQFENAVAQILIDAEKSMDHEMIKYVKVESMLPPYRDGPWPKGQ